MRKLGIAIFSSLNVRYNHYLSYELINEGRRNDPDYFKSGYPLNYFKGGHPLGYYSRRFDKPAVKQKDGTYVWCLDDKWHRVWKAAWIFF